MNMKDRKGFGLRHKESGELLGFYTRSNADGDCCVETEYILDHKEGNMWLIEDAVQADWVRQNSTEWFNADYGTPNHDYEPDELEVVSINVEVKIDVECSEAKAPTPYEFFEEKYAEKEPDHWEYLKGLMSKGEKITYGWWDYASYKNG